MSQYLAAIDRPNGKVDTDAGGLARYSLKIQLPPGIGFGNEPELSLEYCQGCPNGSLGLGWALGGLSCIRRGASHLAFDGANTPPSDYDTSQPKFTLDGDELLNVKGSYGQHGTEYTTEIDNVWRTVTHLDAGFLVLETTGIRKEYGTTDDSRVLGSDGIHVREWRLKGQTDCHGNSVNYYYSTSPDGSSANVNTCYLSEVRYCSNEKAGHQATRIIKLEYSPREDVVVQTVPGAKASWASLLTAVRVGVIRGDVPRFNRAYELAYTRSKSTGDSCITSITETAGSGEDKLELLPTTFNYTSPGIAPRHLFKTVPQKTISLTATTNNVSLFTLNISGRSLPDVAVVRYNPANKAMSVKTYLANKGPGDIMTWTPSNGPGSEASLPVIDLSRGFPNILCPDMNGDGRSDLIIPYRDSKGMVAFSLSQSTGTGFRNYRSKTTAFSWTEGSRFMAVDLTGHGTTDVVQIFTDRQKLAFRTFSGITQNGELGLRDAKLTHTDDDNVDTIDWFTLAHAKTGAMSLVRIWSKDLGKGARRIIATPYFAAASSKGSATGFELRKGKSSILENEIRVNQGDINVVPCDINADGTQDIVLATAKYSSNRMALTYAIFLGNGEGEFEKHGNTVTRQVEASAPLNALGKFHTTNLNGSNYPSVSYVYQEKHKLSYVCLSVDGQCNGSVSEAVVYPLAGNLPNKVEVVPTDLNGNGIGDWLFHTLENDQPRLVPIYNHAGVTDFLSQTTDPMGLQTTISYGELTDPAVYTPAVSWKNYKNDSNDSYDVLGAPNYVVKGIEYRNDPSINSFDYSLSIKKSYSSAIINTKGRGWQGFKEIQTLNATDNILTTEKYFQAWPFTSQKSSIETKTPDGPVVKSEKIFYENAFTSRGPWKIYHPNKILERTDMLDGDVVARSNATSYAYDDQGNITCQSSSETVRDKLTFQSWQRCTYTTINGITGLMVSKKISSRQQNRNMTVFEEGDSSLSLFEYDSSLATLKSISEWSSDVGAFAVKTFAFDEFGNEIRTIDAAGLMVTTTYDDLFKSLVVKVSSTGPGYSAVQLTAFDEASGQEIAKLEEEGMLTCYSMDPFGRVCETRSRSSVTSANTVSAADFFANKAFVTDASFSAILAGCHLDPYRQRSFEMRQSSSGFAYIATRVMSHSKPGIDGQSELFELTDCAKQVRKRFTHHGSDPEKTVMFWSYDSSGHQIFETVPKKVPASSDIDLAPDLSNGVRSEFDVLGRTTTRIRPDHSDNGGVIIFSTSYLDGGAKVQEQVLTAPNAATPLADATQLSVTSKRYVRIGQEDFITEVIDENGLQSSFAYDINGNMVLATDPAGNEERRTYNCKGQLVTLNNVYQSTGSSSRNAIQCEYNAGSQLISQRNAAGEVIKYERDAKGRPLKKIGQDGRTLAYAYDAQNVDKPSSIAIYPQGPSSAFESRFDFAFDAQGRVQQRTLTLSSGETFSTSTSYDWQGEVVQKVFPDGAITTNEYQGDIIKSSTLSGGSASTWLLKADTRYNALQSPENITVQGTGIKDSFEHNWTYDSQGFPTSHSLQSGSRFLVQEHYGFNSLDQMVRKHEFISGSTTNYSYRGRRLESSHAGDGAKNTYEFDLAGNLTQKRGVSITYESERAVGNKDNASLFDVSYDAAGRMVQRTTDGSMTDFVYDAFGWLKSYANTANGTSVEISTDFNGQTLQRKHSDGSLELMIDPDFSIHTQPDGSRIVRHRLSSNQFLLGTVSNTYESADSTRPLGGGRRSVNLPFTDTKGNVTRIYKAEDAELREKLDYDDYGLLESDTSDDAEKDRTSTYEGKRFYEDTGLLDFGGRWFDPLVGRFTTPDDITEMEFLIRTDGLNRYAFENGDPINHTDPTGHWSWSSIVGVVAGAVLVVGAIALTVATGGAAGILVAGAVGAMAGGGIAGITYSIEHKDETDTGKFWKGFGTTVVINAAIGFATGALGAVASPARAVTATSRLVNGLNWSARAINVIGKVASVGGKALIGGVASILTKATERGVSNAFYGTKHDLFADAGASFATGAIIGGIVGAIGLRTPNTGSATSQNKLPGINKFEGSFKLRAFTGVREVLAPKPSNPWLPSFSYYAKETMKVTAKRTAKLAWWGVKREFDL